MTRPINQQWRLAAHPVGLIRPGDFQLTSEPVPDLGHGEVLVASRFLSLDPTNRIWANGAESYLPPVAIGDVMRGVGVGVVEESRNSAFPVGTVVEGVLGWQRYARSDGRFLSRAVSYRDVPLERYLGIARHILLTAYFGLTEVAPGKSGEMLVVSAAAGAVGSLAGQIGRLRGMRVVGIAGGLAKCRWLTELGFDAAIDYKSEDVDAALRRLCPGGIDVYFDNVGGAILDAVLGQMNVFGRVAICGLISGYNATASQPGPSNFANILMHRLRVQGFIVSDHYGRIEAALAEVVPWVDSGMLRWKMDVVEGIERMPVAVNKLFDGTNDGKLVVRV